VALCVCGGSREEEVRSVYFSDMSDNESSEHKKRKAEEGAEELEGDSAALDGVQTDDGLAWDLGGNKFLRVKNFKGKTYVDIREFCKYD
jgi:hypothetical protein